MNYDVSIANPLFFHKLRKGGAVDELKNNSAYEVVILGRLKEQVGEFSGNHEPQKYFQLQGFE